MNNNTLIIEKYGTFSWYFAVEMNSNKVLVGTYPAIITNGVEIVITYKKLIHISDSDQKVFRLEVFFLLTVIFHSNFPYSSTVEVKNFRPCK